MTADGRVLYSTNAAFDTWFQSAGRFIDDMIRHKTITSLLISK